MKVKVIIRDGIVQSVLSTNPVEVEVVDIDKDYEDYENLSAYEQELYADCSLQEQEFTVAHFEKD